MTDLAARRRDYAEQLRSARALQSPALVRAFEAVPRERFLPPGPWFVRGTAAPAGRWTDSDDPAQIYDDVSVALDRDRDLYNGAPGVVAGWLDAVDVQRGDRILHIGAGTGYYTAVLAEMAGAAGQVTAAEIDTDLAATARAALASWPQVTVAGAASIAAETFDVILVHAGATHVDPAWLEALRRGGRLLVPLSCTLPGMSSTLGKGIVTLIRREEAACPTRILGVVIIYSLIGHRNESANHALGDALRRGGWDHVTHATSAPHPQDSRCWLHDAICLRTSDQR